MAGEYLNLHLNQELIIDAIKNYIEGNFKNYSFSENGFESNGATQRK